jgi:DNA polymerase III subunit gamma/tau
MKELYKKYRPKDFGDVIGQDSTVRSLERKIETNSLPHTILLCGPPGCGKTTLGRIIRRRLKCSNWDYIEQNCANKRGIDTIRDIERNMNLSPMKGNVKIWLFDEAHQWSGDAQDALLKILEDTPSHVYFLICSSDPQKLKNTIRSRCTEYAIEPFGPSSLRELIEKVCKAEKRKISGDVIDKIISNSNGSARNALVLLEKVLSFEDEEEQLEQISKATVEVAAIQIARALFDYRTKWPDMAKILKETSLEDPESIRWMILGYARTILLGGGKMSEKAFSVIQIFRDNFYDCKGSGLVACCYEILSGK